VAELRRLLQALGESEEQRGQRLWWSRFRRLPQAGANRSHQQRRSRQAPMSQPEVLSPIRLAGLSRLSDAQWEKIRPLLPKSVFQVRRQVADPRLLIEAMVWVMGTGSSWREIPERFGPWSSVAERSSRGCREGKWTLILQILQEQDVPISSSA
jgi:hypothetical protein